MNEKKTGCVFLVGAGCGRMDLITLRGLRRLENCDTVVYDDLIDRDLLDAAPPEAERLYMGKRRGRHSAPQDEISAVLVEKALEGKRVVRLKGGDPFVFGRGGEEIEALQRAGVPYEEVPGISSAIAVPAAAGIPVTHRGVSRSFHVMTGHPAAGDGLPSGLEQAAALEGTLVFLMGLSNLNEIAGDLLAAGRDPKTPAAVISGSGPARPAAVRGTLTDIAERAAQMQPPAVIVIGGTAGLDFSSRRERPLEGVRLGLTGTAAVAGKLRTALEEQGAETVTVERTLVEPLPLELDLEALCGGTRWLAFTSANGVEVFIRRLRERRVDLRTLCRCRFAVIGAATGKRLEQFGFYPDLCPEVYTSTALAEALRERAAGMEVVLLRSQKGSAELPRILKEAGIPALDIPLYTLRAADGPEVPLTGLDFLVFSSASGVEFFFQRYSSIPDETVCVCIGEVTGRALAKGYPRPFLTAEAASVDEIVKTILRRQTKMPQAK